MIWHFGRKKILNGLEYRWWDKEGSWRSGSLSGTQELTAEFEQGCWWCWWSAYGILVLEKLMGKLPAVSFLQKAGVRPASVAWYRWHWKNLYVRWASLSPCTPSLPDPLLWRVSLHDLHYHSLCRQKEEMSAPGFLASRCASFPLLGDRRMVVSGQLSKGQLGLSMFPLFSRKLFSPRI